MNQDLVTLIKIAAVALSALGSAFATWKIVTDLLRVKRDRLREEYKFAKDFLGESNPAERHPFLSQLGHQAIAGDVDVHAEEIEFLLSLKNPRGAIKDYLLGRQYLQFYATSHPTCISYKQGYEKARKRQLLKIWYVSAYVVTYSLAVSPLLLMSFTLLSTSVAALLFVLSSILFFPLAFLALKAGSKLVRAEKLMEWQEASVKHSSPSRAQPNESFKPMAFGRN